MNVRISLASLLAIGALACGKDAPAPPSAPADEISYELFPSTRVLAPAQLDALTAAEDDGTLVFAVEPPGFEDVAAGSVIVAGASGAAPTGLLRIVARVERDGGALVLRTVGAPLQVAFRKLHVRASRQTVVTDGAFVPVAGVRVTQRQPLRIGGSDGAKKAFDIVLVDGDGDPDTKDDQIAIDALLGGSYRWTLAVDIDWGDIFHIDEVVSSCLEEALKIFEGEAPDCSLESLLPELKATFAVDPGVSMDVTVRGAATLDFDEDLEVGQATMPPIPLGLLVFVPTVDVVAKVKGGASARFEVGASADLELTSDVTLSSKHMGTPTFTPPRLKDWHFDTKDPVIDLHAHAEASVGSRLGLSLYGMAGPYATASAFAAIDAAPLDDPCWTLRLGVESDFGFRVTTPRLPLFGYVELVDWRVQPFRPFDEEVARGTCLVPEDPPLPPGGGPTAPAFREPGFTPWAKILGGAVEGTAATTGTVTTGSPHLDPSIDGRWISTGRFARGLHKVDGDGRLVWTSRLLDSNDRTMWPTRTVPSARAGVVALLAPKEVEAFSLVELNQGGGVVWGRSYTLPSGCNAVATHLLRDGADGYYVLGHCSSGTAGWFVHTDAKGNVVRARTLDEDGVSKVRPTTGVSGAAAPVFSGTLENGGGADWAFVGRFDADDRPATTTAFTCEERLAIAPVAAAAAENDGVTVVGEANGAGFVARVRADGAVGFARFPNLGLGVRDWFAVTSVAELPVTGLIVSAARETTAGAPPSVILAGLDSAGRTSWAVDYTIETPAPRALSWPAARLTDDGGILVTAVAGPDGASDGDLVAMKVFARDGTLGEGLPVHGRPIAVDDYPCPIAERSVAFQVGELDVEVRSLALHRR